MYGDTHILGSAAHEWADICRIAKPQLTVVVEPGGQGLGDQQPSAITSCNGSGLVEQGARVDHVKDFRVRSANHP